MAESIASAANKGPLGLGVPQDGNKPSILTTSNGFTAPLPRDGDSNAEGKGAGALPAVREGAGPAVSYPAPKPVEVKSVPETPVNGATPLEQSPRPELNIPAEVSHVAEPIDGNVAPLDSEVLKVNDTASMNPAPPASSLSKAELGQDKTTLPQGDKEEERAADSKLAPTEAIAKSAPPSDSVMPLTEPREKLEERSAPAESTGEKRKLESESNGDVGRNEKKAKVGAEGAKDGAPRKPGRPKKSMVKKVLDTVVGRTERKTRSQGPADTSL